MSEGDHIWPSTTGERGTSVTLALPDGFTTQLGGHLASVEVRYESWGELNAARTNAVLVIHPMTTDCHVSGEFAGQPTGWWEPLIGPGRAIDPDRHLVVCPNLLGGCYGTTGPRSPAPDGAPYLDRFPLLTPRDMMRASAAFLDALSIERLAMVVGPSMGAMVVWEWIATAPERADRFAVVAAPPCASALQIGWNHLQREALALDLSGGEITGKKGQSLARGVGMLSYRSPQGLHEKFGRTLFKKPGTTLADPGLFNVESWLRHHGKRLQKRFDPLTYALYSRAMDLHDVDADRDPGETFAAVAAAGTDAVVVGISSDQLYPAPEVRAGADRLRAAGACVRYEEIVSANGHDGFLLDIEALAEILRS